MVAWSILALGAKWVFSPFLKTVMEAADFLTLLKPAEPFRLAIDSMRGMSLFSVYVEFLAKFMPI